MAKERKLAATVYVDGKPYEAGTAPPPEIAEQITNDGAWQRDDSGGGEIVAAGDSMTAPGSVGEPVTPAVTGAVATPDVVAEQQPAGEQPQPDADQPATRRRRTSNGS